MIIKKQLDFISFYVMVYFTSAVDGYGMINVEPINGYEDDVNGSINDAYNGIQGDQYTQGNNYRELNNTEFLFNRCMGCRCFLYGLLGY